MSATPALKHGMGLPSDCLAGATPGTAARSCTITGPSTAVAGARPPRGGQLLTYGWRGARMAGNYAGAGAGAGRGPYARMLRRAISPSIWRSAST